MLRLAVYVYLGVDMDRRLSGFVEWFSIGLVGDPWCGEISELVVRAKMYSKLC